MIMKESYFFKTKNTDVVQYGQAAIPIKDTSLYYIPITEEEYRTAIAELEERARLEAEADLTDEVSYEELLAANAELEAENAALLFQLLTGEEFIND